MSPRWSPSRCSKSFAAVALAVALVATPAWAGKRAKFKPTPESLAPVELPQLLKDVEAKYRAAVTLSASFDQAVESVATGRKSKSSGKLAVKRPNQFRWETLKPDKSLAVTDGKKFWHYTPPFDEGDNGQVFEGKYRDISNPLLNQLLGGTFSEAKGMKIEQESPNRFSLIPRKNSAGDVLRAQVTIDPDKKIIENVALNFASGNRTEVQLSEIELGKKLEDSEFKFVAPPKTDHVTREKLEH